MMVTDHINYLTFEDPGAVHTVRRAFKLAHAGDLYGAAETAGVDVTHAAVVGEGLRRGMRFSIGAEVDNDPRARPDAQNIVEAMRPDGIIRSVHFLPIDHPEKGADCTWPFDNPEFAHLFEHVGVEKRGSSTSRELLDDVEKLPGHIVGTLLPAGELRPLAGREETRSVRRSDARPCARARHGGRDQHAPDLPRRESKSSAEVHRGEQAA